MKSLKTKRVILFSALLGIIIWQGINNILIRPMTTVDGEELVYLDTVFWYSSEEAYEIIDTYNAKAIEGYYYFQISDLVLPILYSVLLFIGISLSFKNRWGLFSVAGALFDYLENLSLHLLFRMLPEANHDLAAAANIFGTLKFILLLIAAVMAVISAFRFWKTQFADIANTKKP